LVRCDCAHVFSNPQPSWDELAPFYGDESMYKVSMSKGEFDARVERSLVSMRRGDRLNHVPIVPEGRYLDIGCNLGDMVAAMNRLGMQAEGVEPNAGAARFARDVAGLSVKCGMLHDAAYADQSFDRLSMFHVLEHAPDPVDLLRECLRILRPGGELVIAVPNYKSLLFDLVGPMWLGLDPPRHLHQFSSSSLSKAAERAGLQVAEIETESLPEYVEHELARWLRKRIRIPMRLTLSTHLTRPLATRLAKRGNTSGRGEAIIARFRRPA
jgi:2-polyprenyl-3-methyl-5-hydroxy-6-metoxy-1,4-benzoquinol methylase